MKLSDCYETDRQMLLGYIHSVTKCSEAKNWNNVSLHVDWMKLYKNHGNVFGRIIFEKQRIKAARVRLQIKNKISYNKRLEFMLLSEEHFT